MLIKLMPCFQQVKILPYPPLALFNLVLDIESYPKFLPWCRAARIISHNGTQIIAELVIQLKGFSDKYQSRVIYSDNPVYSIEVEAISGPFKYLKNSWKFSKEDSDTHPGTQLATQIEFFIDFKMKFAIVDKLVGVFFNDATTKMVDAFEKRAQCLLSPTKLIT